MPPRSIPRWLRTALVFLASLQAARAGSVEAQSLSGHRVEQATATSAPRDPIPAIQEPLPVAIVISTVVPAPAVDGSHATAMALMPTKVITGRVGVPTFLLVTVQLPSLEVGAWHRAYGAGAPVRPETRGACRPRAPCPALPLD